jgi:dienelactone hydrolase
MSKAFPALACVLAALIGPGARAADPEPLPGTKPLTIQGDITSQLVDGVDRFLLKKTEESVAKRAKLWNRDVSSPEKYNASVEPNRQRLKHIIGIRDPRVPFEAPGLVGTTAQPALVGKGSNFDIFAVRWPAFGDVHGEGLLLVPTGREKVADVVAILDCEQTPEQIVGLAEGVKPESQYARRLAESGCRVIVPVLIDRKLEPRNGRGKLTTREFLYRSAFELGRHLIGYEVQKVLAAVDWFVKDAKGTDPKIGVFGWGEGGLIAFYAGAVDTRIDAVGVSGYFGPREGLWKEPIDRNVFGLLEQFGDAEVASLVAPRHLVLEGVKGPDFELKPGGSGGPGKLFTSPPDLVEAEINRFYALVGEHRMGPSLIAFNGEAQGYLHAYALGSLLGGLGPQPRIPANGKPRRVDVPPPGTAPTPLREAFDPAPRQARQIHEIDRHNQRLLLESSYVRSEFMKKLDTKSLDAYEKTVEPYREIFRHEVIGHFDDPLLPPDVRSRKVYDEAKYTGYEVVMDVFPDVIAYGILLVPKEIKEGEKRPVVVCQHGLEGRPQDVADPVKSNPAYHQFAVRLAERGFVTFAPQNLYIFQDRFRTLQRKANPLGKTLFSIIVPQHQQITDWLKTLAFVDPSRIGFYGLSYGGKSAMRIPPLVSNYCLSICSADFNEWVEKNASTRSPYSYVWSGEYEIFEWDLGSTFNYAEMATLIAPRPFMVERGHFDGVGSDEAVGHEFAKVRFLYEAKLGIGDRTEIEWFVGPHEIHGVGTFDFLHRHLKWPKP